MENVVIKVNFKTIFLLLIALIVLFFTTLASWYEGAQILDHPLEWKYTAVFSNWINGEIVTSKDILMIDYFVYAAKFAPIFPLVTISSLLFVVFQMGFLIFKDNKMLMSIFLGFMAIGSFVVSGVLFSSPTEGLILFSIFFGIVGIISAVSLLLLKKAKKMKICQLGIIN
ncbi:DUF4306 domain-containing protein [Viridibacillus sp. YIM B01967]|uniref:DUF4306 domain-containing protein n=1 Tax=Viridibacillus soli TaxID=2798301 RepID=A0ABS1HAF8_9BACL|nr:DUF4306 domain-containing protein [Viridibacillus soli]MBK3496415.1 DUF4306 domain-containing protein [Viridibacillus soli]